MKILLSNRGNIAISIPIMLVAVMMVLTFALQVYPTFVHKQKLDSYAAELCRVAELSGRVGEETAAKQFRLNQVMNISPSVVWSKNGKIQLNDSINVTCTITDHIKFFGGIGSIPVTITGKATGQSEVYWK